MGQYYKVINIDKKQFLHPHRFGDGLKLMEFGPSGGGTMLALSVLLASGNGQGGGDLHCKNDRRRQIVRAYESMVGSWAGDRIVIAGDYDDPDLFGISTSKPSEEYGDQRNLYTHASDEYEDVSLPTYLALLNDNYVVRDLAKRAAYYGSDEVIKAACSASPEYKERYEETKKKIEEERAARV